MSITAPYRYDVVGSFLRPDYLRKARAEFEAGRLDAEELKAIEDRAVTELVNKEKEAGLHVITDGEFRRLTWHLDFMWNIDGVKRVRSAEGNTTFNGEAAAIDDVTLEGKLSLGEHPFIEHFRFLKQFEDENTAAKLTIPSPGQFYALFTGRKELENTLDIYGTNDRFADAVVKVYREFIGQFYEAGGRILQLDDCTWGGFVNATMATALTGLPKSQLPSYMNLLADINNRVIDLKPADMVINTHVCRGNYHSTFFSSGPYSEVAEPLFGGENVDAYYLEFDDERSGGFEPLKYVSGDKKVVLGLVTTKRPELEDKEKIIERIYEAAKYVPLERLYLSPQCGFASCEIGNKLTDEEQWAKVRLVREIAEEVWKEALVV
ncbi:MAG: 5-methyltetrahydropteroyltriglutamate--homocysteine S-methyltransferase [Lachnospiraceae bacterium]|nr:5-methyltetrahydropteroyltriglutamate--homocysteine S-methyltransferase [Lachnospiraceae bacterium]